MSHSVEFAHIAKAALLLHRKGFSFANPKLSAVEGDFWTNVRRARSLLFLPGYAFMSGEHYGLHQRHIKTWTDYVDYERSSINIEKHSEDSWEYAKDALEDTLKSVAIQSWAAFEALAESLYNLAREEAKIPLARPVHPKDGHIMKVEFRSLRKIQYAYEAAFNVDGTAINNTFKTPALDALRLLRNVIVHKASRVDKEFREGVDVECKNTNVKVHLLSAYYHLGDDSPVLLNGKVLLPIVFEAIEAGYNLLKEVDEWLKIH